MHTDEVVCILCPGMEYSTSAWSGGGWLLLPNVTDPDPLLYQLQMHAAEFNVSFDMLRARHFIQETQNAMDWLFNETGVYAEPVPSFSEVHQSPCSSVPSCCKDDQRFIPNHGVYSCDDSKRWYQDSGCCQNTSQVLNAESTWPPYIHLKNQLQRKIMWLSDAHESNKDILSVMNAMLPSTVHRFFGENVESITGNGAAWHIQMPSRTIDTRKIIFANGGFGARATTDELKQLAVEDTQYVHASGNTRILRDLAFELNWPQEDLNAWFLEFADGIPKWFLWEKAATVLDENDTLVYDESMSYDQRGRVRQQRNISRARLVYAGSSSTPPVELSEVAWQRITASNPSKDCNTRSKRLWRNFLASEYGIGSKVDIYNCSRRIERSDTLVMQDLYQGIIDTISGPKVDERQQLITDASVAVCGNAASPSLIGMYLAPGSTLGNAFVTGYISAKYL